MKIYTRLGDFGETDLFDGQRVEKTNARVVAFGTLDEANAVLGVAISAWDASADANHVDVQHILLACQRLLFVAGSDLASPLETTEYVVPRIIQEDILWCESVIDRITELLPELRAFILPGGVPTAAAVQLARTIVRRAERDALAVIGAGCALNPFLIPLLNRMSDLLFTVGRRANQVCNVSEAEWNANIRR